MKACIAFPVAFAALVASEDVLFDEGLSLLQMRAQSHTDAQEEKYFTGGLGTDCAPEEDLNFAQCLEAQVKKLIPNTIAAHGIIYNQRSGGYMQRGCFIIGGNIYFSDEPVGGRLGRGAARIQPICGKNGGFNEYIASSEISCKEADCTHKPSNEHLLNWGDAVKVPEIQILGAGEICEPCGVLSYAQCSKAGDTGLIAAVYGKRIEIELATQCSGGGHTRPAMPSGCSVSVQLSHGFNFCPYDTPDGALAGLVTESGAGVGFGRVRPVCGVCTTTTTTPEPPPPPAVAVEGEDQAAAAGDPHLQSTGGATADMCCEGEGAHRHCKPCS